MTSDDASRVYLIGGRHAEQNLSEATVGSKAANLSRLNRLGLTVPPALALPAALCREYLQTGALRENFASRLTASVRQLEEATGCTLGGRRPLLVSVRSSPPTSMPGMLGTVLNVGLTEDAVRGLIRRTGNPWLAWDVYRRFSRSFGEAVNPESRARFDRLTDQMLRRADVETIQDLDPMAMRELAHGSADELHGLVDSCVWTDPVAQIITAVEAVFRSWTSPSARLYRELNALDENSGTGVLIQAMVFGNSGARSGSGVGFTRNPVTGERELYVDFVFNAQGEDVVAGRQAVSHDQRLASTSPDVWQQLSAAQIVLEHEFRDMQDFEFTMEEGRLFFLQTRPGKRTPWAALRIATDFVQEGMIEPADALERLAPYDLTAIAHVTHRRDGADRPLAPATAASMGVATGAIAFRIDRVQALAARGPVIMVRSEMSTEDVAGLAAAAGVLTTYGARTSHAAVVARQLGKVCLVGCADLRVDENGQECSIGGRRLREGDVVTLDGDAGLVYDGSVPVAVERPDDRLALVDRWRTELALQRHSAVF